MTATPVLEARTCWNRKGRLLIFLVALAIIGDGARRHWAWAILFAVVLELGMLFTPYSTVFNIPITARFVVVTMAAHAIFGFCLGLSVLWLSLRTQPNLPVGAAMARF